jgi:hypothetical protein
LQEKLEAAMTDTLTHHPATFTPQLYKSFDGALEAFLRQECPQLGGARTRQVLVHSIRQRVEAFFPATTHLRAGQTLWSAVHKDEKSSYGKTIPQSRLPPSSWTSCRLRKSKPAPTAPNGATSNARPSPGSSNKPTIRPAC